MAKDLKEVLAQYVPASVLDEAVQAVSDTEIAPDWFRQEAAKLGADAKEAAELRTKLESIELAPKRKEALGRVGIQYDDQPKFAQRFLDSIDAKTLDDLDKLAETVKNEGFDARLQPEHQGDPNQVEQIVNFTSETQGAPLKRGSDEDFYREFDAVPDGDKEASRRVLEKYGKAQPSEGLMTTVTKEG